MKTGALLKYGCIAGALLGQATKEQYDALDAYGHAFGEAFQIADDLLDYVSDADTLGKNIGDELAGLRENACAIAAQNQVAGDLGEEVADEAQPSQ